MKFTVINNVAARVAKVTPVRLATNDKATNDKAALDKVGQDRVDLQQQLDL